MMCPAIDNPASCKLSIVIHFLHTKSINAVEIRRELCSDYGQNAISEGTVREWCRMFTNGWTDVHDEELTGRPSAVYNDLVQSVDQQFVKDSASQFQIFHVNFHKLPALYSTRL
jgi:hypothetical protein